MSKKHHRGSGVGRRHLGGNVTPTVRNLLASPSCQQVPTADDCDIIDGRLPPRERLSFGPLTTKRPVDYRVVADFIHRFNPPNMAFYLDTNFLTGDEKPAELWDALLEKTIVITPLVWRELEPWLESPFRNRRMRDRLLDARLSPTSAIRFETHSGWHPFHVLALKYYVNLLCVRKRMGNVLRDEFVDRNGRNPTKPELDSLIQATAAEHDFHLLRKGCTDISKDTFFADEELVVTAVLDAIIVGRESTIMTTDNDIQEQFAKLMRLLDWQYEALLFAEKFTAGRESFVTESLNWRSPI